MSPGLSGFFETSSSSTSSSQMARRLTFPDVVTVQHKRVLNLIKKNQKQFNVTQKAVAGLKGVSFIPIH